MVSETIVKKHPPHRWTRALLAAGGMFVLAACSGAASITTTDAFAALSPAYAPGSVWYAAKDGMRAVIHGNPFAVPQAETDQAVLSALRLPRWHQRAQFVSYPTDGKRRGYRLVLVFNTADPIGHGKACRDLQEIGVGPGQGVTRIHAAFCTGERLLSHLNGQVAVSGPNDPALRTLLARTMDQLLPPRNFVIDDGCASPRRVSCDR